MESKHQFAEMGSRYALRCVRCGVPAHEASGQPCIERTPVEKDAEPTDLDAVDALCAAATPEPWLMGSNVHRMYMSDNQIAVNVDPRDARVLLSFNVHFPYDGDRAFVLESRTLLPKMNAELRLARAQLTTMQERLARIDLWAGRVCESQMSSDDPHGPVEYTDSEDVPLCAECWADLVAETEGEDGGA